MECYTCKALNGERQISPGQVIYDGKYWLIDHAYPTKLLGWLVIVLKRHCRAMHEVTNDEYQELATLQKKTIKIIHKLTNSDNEYVACFAEAEHFEHVHVHIIPKTDLVTEEYKGTKVFQFLKTKADDAISKESIDELGNNFRREIERSDI